MTHQDDSAGRRHVNCWTDASGEARWLAAVVHADGMWLWTRVQVPQVLWDQLIPREDHQIGLQELFAVVLAVHTFRPQLEKCLLSVAVDNQGVLHSVIQGRAAAEDANRCIAKFWLDAAEMEIAVHLLRVESFANLAVGPMRDDLSLMTFLNASFVEPRLPCWPSDIWEV